MAEEKSLPKTVQELSENGEELPQNYVWTSNIEVDAPLATYIPIIDISGLISPMNAELVKLRAALTKWGCFQVIALPRLYMYAFIK